ncbi:MAG TPA: hypothetical protein VHN11_08800 [Xanthobacteraceae bacterium]|nr:hypothetical protein [Xanthobacteraceae bacterium]
MRLKVFISKETDDGWRQDLFHVVMERDDAALRIHAGAGDEDVRRVMRGLRDTAEQWLEDEKVFTRRAHRRAIRSRAEDAAQAEGREPRTAEP